jgi:hypothetical protein
MHESTEGGLETGSNTNDELAVKPSVRTNRMVKFLIGAGSSLVAFVLILDVLSMLEAWHTTTPSLDQHNCLAPGASSSVRFPDNLVFVKLVKVGGSTFSGCMRRFACKNGLHKYSKMNFSTTWEEPEPRVYAAHTPRRGYQDAGNAKKWGFSDMRHPVVWITLVRHPVGRCVSNFFYVLNGHSEWKQVVKRRGLERAGANVSDAAIKVVVEEELIAYCENKAHNLESAYIQLIGASLEESLAAYDLVATTERFAESLVLVTRVLHDAPLSDFLYLKSKVAATKKRGSEYTVRQRRPVFKLDEMSSAVHHFFEDPKGVWMKQTREDYRLHATANTELDRKRLALRERGALFQVLRGGRAEVGVDDAVLRMNDMLKELAEECSQEKHGDVEFINQGYMGDNGKGYRCIDVYVKQQLAEERMQRP